MTGYAVQSLCVGHQLRDATTIPPRETIVFADFLKADIWVGTVVCAVPVTRTADGLRALSKDKPIEPASARKYLQSKFGDALGDATEAMRTLAGSLGADDLAHRGFRLYEAFRPDVPAGTKGWGARGRLDLDKIGSLAT